MGIPRHGRDHVCCIHFSTIVHCAWLQTCAQIALVGHQAVYWVAMTTLSDYFVVLIFKIQIGIPVL